MPPYCDSCDFDLYKVVTATASQHATPADLKEIKFCASCGAEQKNNVLTPAVAPSRADTSLRAEACLNFVPPLPSAKTNDPYHDYSFRERNSSFGSNSGANTNSHDTDDDHFGAFKFRAANKENSSNFAYDRQKWDPATAAASSRKLSLESSGSTSTNTSKPQIYSTITRADINHKPLANMLNRDIVDPFSLSTIQPKATGATNRVYRQPRITNVLPTTQPNNQGFIPDLNSFADFNLPPGRRLLRSKSYTTNSIHQTNPHHATTVGSSDTMGATLYTVNDNQGSEDHEDDPTTPTRRLQRSYTDSVTSSTESNRRRLYVVNPTEDPSDGPPNQTNTMSSDMQIGQPCPPLRRGLHDPTRVYVEYMVHSENNNRDVSGLDTKEVIRKSLRIDVYNAMTASQLKSKLNELTGIPIPQQFLYFETTHSWGPDFELGQLCLEEGDIIYCDIKV